MKSQWLGILIIIIGTLGLFVISRIFVPQTTTPELQNQNTAAEKAENAISNAKTESSLPAGWQKIEAENFSLNIPTSWFIFKEEKTGKILGLSSASQEEAYMNPNEVVINIEEFSKDEKKFWDVVAEKSKNQTTAATAVELMKNTTPAPFNEITLEDIKTSTENINFDNGLAATKNIYQCLKPCDLDGFPYTLTQFFIETPKTILLFSVLTGIDERAQALELVAEQIIKTFEEN